MDRAVYTEASPATETVQESPAKFIVFEDRLSDSPWVERVWRSHSERAGRFHSVAAVHWEMVVTRHAGRTFLTVRGPETRATVADCPTEGEWVAIRFKLGTFMPRLPAGTLRDRRDVTMPAASSRSFWLNGSAWEYPSFENAESFVKRLVKDGLIAFDALERPHGIPSRNVSKRTEQRHFLRATGLTQTAVQQIERARHATYLLKRGLPILDVVYEAGYYDQAHLTRSLKGLIGQTPAQILRGEAQLSFLYNTHRA